MPFVKRELPAPPAAPHSAEDSLASHIAGLGRPDPDARWGAARALGGYADAVPALACALNAEQVPRVREAIATALVRIGDETSVKALLPSLRSQDAGHRAAAIEALQSLPDVTLPFMPSLLADTDADVRILATELARNMSVGDANRLLCGLLDHDLHPNVCAAAIEVLAEVGTRDAVPAIEACARRFADTPFLLFAASTAIARISNAKG
jgi:HEAT repeat protein